MHNLNLKEATELPAIHQQRDSGNNCSVNAQFDMFSKKSGFGL